MINIYAEHGEHGNFLSMSLNVLEGNFDLKNNKSGATFDFWTGTEVDPKQDKKVLSWKTIDYQMHYKTQGVENTFTNDDKRIWIIKDKPMLWVYNVCTRAVMYYQSNYGDFDKGIDIDEFENYPWNWCPYCDLFQNTAYSKIGKKPNGTSNKKDLRKFYYNSLFGSYFLARQTPTDVIKFRISSFYNKQAFIENIKEVETALGKTYDYSKIDDLYTALHNRLSYDDEMAHTRQTNLLQVYNSIDPVTKSKWTLE